MNNQPLVDLLWKGLKEQGCVHPDTAVCIVMVHKHDVAAMVKANEEKIKQLVVVPKNKFRSVAVWPAGTICDGIDVSTDTHETFEQAEAVCKLLQTRGFGGMRKIFPISTHVETFDESLTFIRKVSFPS